MVDNENVKPPQFRIKVRKGDWEIEVSAPEKDFVLDESNRLIEQFSLGNGLSSLSKDNVIQSELNNSGGFELSKTLKPQTLNEFYRQFKFQTNLDRIIVFGYWCEVKLRKTPFTIEDILAKYKEAKQPPPANIRRDIGSLVSKGFFMEAGRTEDGTLAYELTRTGIEEVENKLSQSSAAH
jgi:hypothetical protein